MNILIPRDTGVRWTNFTGADKSKLQWLLYTCCLQASRSEFEHFPLSHRVLQIYCGNNYARLRNYLCEVGFLVPVNHANGCLYYDGHARLFRLGEWVDLSSLKRVKLPGTFTRKTRETKQYLRDEVCTSIDGGRDLLRCLDMVKLDKKQAASHVDGLQETGASKGSVYVRRHISNEGISDRVRYSDLTGRLYNGLTGLPKDLRRFVRVSGVDRLGGVDAKSCHPFILAGLYWEETGDNEPLRVAASGTFWTELMQYCPGLSKDEVKEGVLPAIYANERKPWSDGGKALVRAFPGFWEWICKQDRRKGRGHLSHRISKIEGAWFIGAAVDLHRATGLWVATLHDCLVVPWEARRVARVYLEGFPLKRWGRVPTFDFEKW